MTTETTDVRSNPQEQIHHAASVIGGSQDRRKVFEAICFGKKKVKPISEIESRTGLSHKRVLEEGAKLHNSRLVRKTKINGEMTYEKDDFLSSKINLILKLADDPKALAAFPTKSNPRPSQSFTVNFHVPKELVNAEHLNIDIIDSFAKVKDVPLSMGRPLVPIDEEAFQQGLQKVIGEQGTFTDWGGETDDVFSTRLLFRDQRATVAFGLKGKGTRGLLVPAKMGRNGDQIQRLFRAQAEIFLVQYWGQIDESILEQMKNMAITKSLMEQGKTIYYGIIDGQDTQRIIAAYPQCFQIEKQVLAGPSEEIAENVA